MVRLDKYNVDYVEKPYNDDKLVYNYDENRYVLTVQGANESKLDMVKVFKNEDNLSEYLELMSRTLYAVFMVNKDSKYYEKMLWILSHSKHFRESIFKIYMDTIWYNFGSGGFMLAYQTGINLNEMKELKLGIENALSVIGNKMADIFGLNERIPRYKIVDLNRFKTLDEVKSYLIDKNVYTAQYLADKDTISEIPSTLEYSIYKNILENNREDNLCIDDYTFWNSQLLLKGKEW